MENLKNMIEREGYLKTALMAHVIAVSGAAYTYLRGYEYTELSSFESGHNVYLRKRGAEGIKAKSKSAQDKSFDLEHVFKEIVPSSYYEPTKAPDNNFKASRLLAYFSAAAVGVSALAFIAGNVSLAAPVLGITALANAAFAAYTAVKAEFEIQKVDPETGYVMKPKRGLV